MTIEKQNERETSKNTKNPQKAKYPLGNLLVSFMRQEPFFAYVISRLTHQSSTEITTAGVYVREKRWYLLYNVDFLSSLSREQCFGLLKHECYHLIFDHCTNRSYPDKELWNIATDLAINSLIPLKELPEGALLPAQEYVLPHPSSTTDRDLKRIVFEINTIFENLPPDQSAEYYYKELQSNAKLQKLRLELNKKNIDLCGDTSHKSLIPMEHHGWQYEDGENQIQDRLDRIFRLAYQDFADSHHEYKGFPY